MPQLARRGPRLLALVEKIDGVNFTSTRAGNANADFNAETITGMSATVQKTERPLRVEVQVPFFASSVITDQWIFVILEDAAVVRYVKWDCPVVGECPGPVKLTYVSFAAPGAHTYALAVVRNLGTGTLTVVSELVVANRALGPQMVISELEA